MGNIKKRGKYKKKKRNIDALKVYLNKNIKNGERDRLGTVNIKQ